MKEIKDTKYCRKTLATALHTTIYIVLTGRCGVTSLASCRLKYLPCQSLACPARTPWVLPPFFLSVNYSVIPSEIHRVMLCFWPQLPDTLSFIWLTPFAHLLPHPYTLPSFRLGRQYCDTVYRNSTSPLDLSSISCYFLSTCTLEP